MLKSYLFNKVLNFTEYHLLPAVSKTTSSLRQRSFSGIGKRKLPYSSPKALVINISTAIPYYLEGNIYRCPILDKHALYWEVGEMVRQLNEAGFIVDFIDCNQQNSYIDWPKYNLVFDERNNLMYAPPVVGQKRVFYSTGLHWHFHNQQELKRINWFYERTGIREYPQRMLLPNFSDEFADYQTYYGRENLMNLFSAIPKKIPLDVSCTYIPTSFNKTKRNPNRFVWFGSSGSVHKGLDLVVEAFQKMPTKELLIFGPAKYEQRFFSWLQKLISKSSNIKYLGIANLNNQAVLEYLQTAVGNIFPSCSEGGPGAVAQTALLGLVPFVTPTANVRYSDLGYLLGGASDEAIISSIKENVNVFGQLTEKEILGKSEAVFLYAREHHTRDAYQKSFHTFLNQLI